MPGVRIKYVFDASGPDRTGAISVTAVGKSCNRVRGMAILVSRVVTLE